MTRPFYSLEHYGKRLDRVLEYIDANLAMPLRLSVLAAEASFSPNHFHQVFREWQGETPQSYIRRCRLERGAALLRYGPGTAVKEIAPQCGFASVEAFDRAFQSYFGMTPSEWRSGGHARWNMCPDPSPAISLDLSKVEVEVKCLPPVRAIYRRKVGPYKDGEAAVWELLAQVTAPFGLAAQPCFGIGLDDPRVTPAARCRFDACVSLPSSIEVPANTPVRLIHGGYHAVLPYHGARGCTEEHWSWLFKTWLPQSGYKVSQHACFEHYPDGMPNSGMAGRSELCLPLLR